MEHFEFNDKLLVVSSVHKLLQFYTNVLVFIGKMLKVKRTQFKKLEIETG